MKLECQKLLEDATIPKYATKGSACFDLHAYLGHGTRWSVPPNGSIIVPTGLAFEVPKGYVMLIFGRSGNAFKSDTRLANCVGVIDSDYRGEVQIKLTNDNQDRSFYFVHGDRIAQALLIPIQIWEIVEVKELSETDRGAGGLGSTGA